MSDTKHETFTDMLRRVREVDPGADAEAVRRYAREIAEADAVVQTLDVEPMSAPFDTPFSPGWKSEQTDD